MMDALKRMKPTCIEDIVAFGGAFSPPPPMENIPTYCEVKNGEAGARICTSTDRPYLGRNPKGIIVYQEQVYANCAGSWGVTRLGGAGPFAPVRWVKRSPK